MSQSRHATLVLLAAGLGTRFGGCKQLEPVGPSGETLLHYSVFDAVRAGVDSVLFVIRPEMEQQFRRTVADPLEEFTARNLGKALSVRLAFQRLDDLPAGVSLPSGRTRPWGTAHAVLAARGLVTSPFLVANADDFYGLGAFRLLADFLSSSSASAVPQYAVAGFPLHATLSPHGPVARAVCITDAHHVLHSIIEYKQIRHDSPGALDDATGTRLNPNDPVSMNLWAFTPALFPQLESLFHSFLAQSASSPAAEFYLSTAVQQLIHAGTAQVRVLPASGPWFGITWPQDRDHVVQGIAELIAAGHYPRSLIA